MKTPLPISSSIIALSASLLIASPITSTTVFAAETGNQAQQETTTKTFQQVIKDSHELKGLFTLYQDKNNGSLMMRIKPSQLDKEFIHFMQNLDGIADIGYFRGGYRGANIYSIERHFNKIEVRAENTSFYFDPDSPLAKASSANINRPLLASIAIEAEDTDTGDIIIKADELFLTENLRQIKPSSRPDEKPGESFKLGTLSKDKTKVLNVHNYPQNTDLEVEYVYDNPTPVRPHTQSLSNGDFAFTDDRSIAIKIRHSFIELPENDFIPRLDDPRIGYFSQLKHDMTAKDDSTPFRDVINRWYLSKKNPGEKISEPVEPIVWWIENTTPVEFRETIKQATLSWNSAFEKAGFKNAIQVKIQPDDATWDAGDIRYNVLRWTSSPRPVFSGYGPSFANPRTGQILGADVMLEYTGFTRRLDVQKIFDANTFINNDSSKDSHSGLYQTAQFGTHALLAAGAETTELTQFTKEFLYYLVLHEVGHTLGLNHNMKASQLHDSDTIHDSTITSKTGLTGSVMDYPSINFSPLGKSQGQYYTAKPGAYDDWVIDYGYSEESKNTLNESIRLEKILARSTEPELAFGNDADDMRSPGSGIDPRINIYDMSSNPISYAEDRLIRVNDLISKLQKRFSIEGESYQTLTNAFMALNGEYSRNTQVVSRYIGGVYVDRAFVGQKDAIKPFIPVEKSRQKKAMALLEEFLFSAEAFKMDSELLSHLQQQRRSFYLFGNTEDPKMHDMILNMQKAVLNHLLHPRVLKRIQDSALYGNQYKLAEMLEDLTNAIFLEDAKKNVNSFRQNLQREYVERLVKIISNEGQHSAQSLARLNLKKIGDMLKTRRNNVETVAHKEQINFLIKQAFKVKQ